MGKVLRSENAKEKRKDGKTIDAKFEVVDDVEDMKKQLAEAEEKFKAVAAYIDDIYKKMEAITQQTLVNAQAMISLNDEMSRLTGDNMRKSTANEEAHNAIVAGLEELARAIQPAVRVGIDAYMKEQGLIVEEEGEIPAEGEASTEVEPSAESEPE